MNDESNHARESDEKKKNENNSVEVDVETIEEDVSSLEELQSRIQQLEQELEEQKKEASKNLDMSKRIQAAFDNYKKRVEKDRVDYEFHVKKNLFIPILDVLASFARAIVSIETNIDEDQSTSAELLKGIKLINDQLVKVLDDQGVKPIAAIGEEFDPIKHDVVFIEEKEDYDDNKVIEEFETGYLLGSRVLRPTKVKVSKKKVVTKKEEEKKEEEVKEEEK
ncbi:MAG: nucleotide exchange factor GrpE [Candidatus Odinarchaeota archaeon]